MESVTVWLSEKDAGVYPFSYQIGERLRSPTNSIEGIVKNAKYTGQKESGSGSITYYIQTDNGDIIEIPEGESEKGKEDLRTGK